MASLGNQGTSLIAGWKLLAVDYTGLIRFRVEMMWSFAEYGEESLERNKAMPMNGRSEFRVHDSFPVGTRRDLPPVNLSSRCVDVQSWIPEVQCLPYAQAYTAGSSGFSFWD